VNIIALTWVTISVPLQVGFGIPSSHGWLYLDIFDTSEETQPQDDERG
jgi:hypothetical protein